MAKIFISYSSHDASFADSLYSALEDAGHEVWMDREKLEGGDAWLQTIQDNIHWADSLLVVWSAHALESRWVKAEITFAHAHHKQIIPLQIDDTDGSEHIIINSLQVINARSGALSGVLRKIEIALMSNPEVTVKIIPVGTFSGDETANRPRPLGQSWRSRNVMLGVVIVLVLLVALLPLLRPNPLESPPTTLTAPVQSTVSPTPERVTLDSLNQWRQANDVPPLVFNSVLNAVAERHMRDLRNRPLSVAYDEYRDEAGQDGQAMAASDGYSGTVVLAIKITDAPAVLAELTAEMVSQGGDGVHTDYSEAGFAWGTSIASGKYYYVLVLGSPA